MSTKRRILLPSINGITAGSAIGAVGTFDLPIGYRYHRIELVYIDGGATPTDVLAVFGDVVVYKNTRAQRIHTAAELDHLNGLNCVLGDTEFNRQQVNTAAAMRQILPIYFAEPWRKDKVDTDFLAWNVSQPWGWNSFQIKITLAAAMPATGSIVAYALVDDPLPVTNGGVQAVKKVYRQQIPASGTSVDITTLDAADAYQVIALKNPSTTGYISKVSFKRNGVPIVDQVWREDNVAALVQAGLSPANSVATGAFGYDIVLDADDPVNSALVAQGQSLWLQPTFNTAAAGNVVALIERLGNFDN